MKTKVTAITVGLTLILAPTHFGYSRVGGVYKGISKDSIQALKGGPSAPFPNIRLKQRLPNGKGKMSGVWFSKSEGADGDVRITGRVRKHLIRQGGKKHVYIGSWTWNFRAVGAYSNASGRFRTTIKGGGGKSYRISPPTNVRLMGNGPPAFIFKSKVTGKK